MYTPRESFWIGVPGRSSNDPPNHEVGPSYTSEMRRADLEKRGAGVLDYLRARRRAAGLDPEVGHDRSVHPRSY